MKKPAISLILCVIWAGNFASAREVPASEQVRVTATPVRVIIPTPTIQATDIILSTPTPTWTPTPEGPVQLRVPSDSGEVNVRAEPDPAAQRLGAIRPGETFIVRGRYFSWLLFDFAQSPTGTGWVYDALVEIVGDSAQIPSIDPYAEPTSPSEAGQTGAEGGENSAEVTDEAEQRVIILPTGAALDPVTLGGFLPTFTPMAEGVAVAVFNDASITTANNDANSQSTGGIPPIFPVMALIGFGLLGFLVGTVRK